MFLHVSPVEVRRLIEKGSRLPLATKNYPSRGQTATQALYFTSRGKLFLKRSSLQNHIDCRIDEKTGTLAEREYWAYRLAKSLSLAVPQLWLLDKFTTVQIWFNLPDARQFSTSQGRMDFQADCVFNCSLFDWLTGQIDRHDANYLFDYIRREIILIDSAHCFLKYNGSIPDYLRYFEIGFPKELSKTRSTSVSIAVGRLKKNKLKRLVPLPNALEAAALEKRLKQVQEARSIKDIVQLYRDATL